MALADVYQLLDNYGADCGLTRIDPPGPAKSVTVPMVARRSQELPLAGDVSQYAHQYFVRQSTLSTAGFPIPPLKGDRVTESGRTFVVNTVEDLHDDSGVAQGYRLWVRGH